MVDGKNDSVHEIRLSNDYQPRILTSASEIANNYDVVVPADRIASVNLSHLDRSVMVAERFDRSADAAPCPRCWQ